MSRGAVARRAAARALGPRPRAPLAPPPPMLPCDTPGYVLPYFSNIFRTQHYYKQIMCTHKFIAKYDYLLLKITKEKKNLLVNFFKKGNRLTFSLPPQLF